MDDVKRFEDKIDKIYDKMASMDNTLIKQSVILEEHTRRSLANEESVKILSEELKPIITHVTMVKLCIKILFTIIGSGSLIEVIKWLYVK